MSPPPTPPDHHLHTTFSDGDGEVEDYVRRAAELGVPEIGFTDHLVPASFDYLGYGIARGALDDYVERVRAAATLDPRVRVLLGVEVDFVPGATAEIEALLDRCAPDYVIGSVHFVGGFGFDETRNRDSREWERADEIYRGYWELVTQAAGWGRVDVVGHLELPKKFGRRPAADLSAAEDAALAAVAAAGQAIEINTSGLRGPVGETYPSLRILTKACALGIPLTFGSDAHRPADVARDFAAAVAIARRAGYDHSLRLSDAGTMPLP